MIMRYVKQVLIIFGMSFLGEICYALIPLPIPASIYGMVLLFAALAAGIFSVDDVKKFADFLLNIMPLLFIPAGVGLMGEWGDLEPILLPAAVVTVVTTVLVMGVSGRVTQGLLRRRKEKTDEAGKGNERI